MFNEFVREMETTMESQIRSHGKILFNAPTTALDWRNNSIPELSIFYDLVNCCCGVDYNALASPKCEISF